MASGGGRKLMPLQFCQPNKSHLERGHTPAAILNLLSVSNGRALIVRKFLMPPSGGPGAAMHWPLYTGTALCMRRQFAAVVGARPDDAISGRPD